MPKPERINSPPLTSRKWWGFIKLHYMSCIASHSSVIHLAYHETWKEINYHYSYICPNIYLREFQVPPHPFFAQIWTVVYALIYEFLYWFLPRLICTSFHLINSIPLFIFSIHLPTSHIYRFHTPQVIVSIHLFKPHIFKLLLVIHKFGNQVKSFSNRVFMLILFYL